MPCIIKSNRQNCETSNVFVIKVFVIKIGKLDKFCRVTHSLLELVFRKALSRYILVSGVNSTGVILVVNLKLSFSKFGIARVTKI